MRYYFNYSAAPAAVRYPYGAGKELLAGAAVALVSRSLPTPWGVQIVEEK